MKKRTKEKKQGEEEKGGSVLVACFWGLAVGDRKSAAVCFLRKAKTSDVLSILFCHHMQNMATFVGLSP